ncbi:uncharacterized protein BDR25DRAFT_347059 [Lindgomyces ingoldianus]|uniref:Uncharacterized protein n=1 Tax=Lindgomyces ingoldianus TaxID=673940 RepID=A0ACB6Q9Y8_9PLEO|nr:uncharacterized protein BDR25DRAFT_347059 [Lindgomyces ingoldianus]KAF2463726.1 hypothetical protein BDR25DRAFT_347059 [Lindgomyces ingoldianus]
MASTDPWLWSVDDVVNQVCHSQRLFEAAGWGPPNCPDPKVFEDELRGNEISGAAFLTGIDDDFLKRELNIHALGRRRALLAVVAHLRNLSPKYALQAVLTGDGITQTHIPIREQHNSQPHFNSHEIMVVDGSGRKRRKIEPFHLASFTPPTEPIPAAKSSSEHEDDDQDSFNNDVEESDRSGEEDESLEDSEAETDYSWSEDLDVYDFNDADSEEEASEDTHAEEGQLSRAQVNAIMDERIAYYQQEWELRELPEERRQAFGRWNRPGSPGYRSFYARLTKREIEKFRIRLRTVRRDMRMLSWNDEDALRQLCSSFENTVYQMEKEKFNLQIFLRDSPPPKQNIPRAPKPSRRQPQPIDEEGEEVTDDEDSDIEENFMDLHDFIVSDEEDGSLKQAPNFCPASELDSVVGDDSSPVPPEPCEDEGRKRLSTAGDRVEVDSPEEIGQMPFHTVETFIDLGDSSDTQSNCLSMPDSTSQKFAPDILPATTLLTSNPALASAEEIAQWAWGEVLEDDHANERTLLKLLYEMGEAGRTMLRNRISQISRDSLMREIKRCVTMFAEGENKMEGILRDDLTKIIKLTKLFLSFYLRGNYSEQDVADDDMRELQEVLKDGLDFDLGCFFDLTEQFLGTIFQQTPNSASSQAQSRAIPLAHTEIITISSDDADERPNPKKRKKKPSQSAREAKKRQNIAHQRQQDQASSQHLLPQDNIHTVSSNPNDIISTGTHGQTISLCAEFAHSIKSHQTDGVRFMWRELVSAGEDDCGCVLAHTMGLGKTFQTIVLLTSIALAASTPTTRAQVPKRLRESRTLILAPAMIVPYWVEELKRWTPDYAKRLLGPVRKITSNMLTDGRVAEVDKWSNGGGILVIGYHLFRNLFNGEGLEDELTRSNVHRQLKDSAHIVVADEAQFIKNEDAKITTAVNQLRTTRRVALTGTPLANHMEEYFFLIDWASPGYLGKLQDFRYQYKNPIEQGLYAESYDGDYRRALKRLRVLEQTLEPKVHRRDFRVLQKDLPPKLEFLITLPLSEFQEKTYKVFVEMQLKGTEGKKISNATLWAWLPVLSLLCTHPMIFCDRLFNRPNKWKKNMEALNEGDVSSPWDVEQNGSVEQNGNLEQNSNVKEKAASLDEQMLKRQREMFDSASTEVILLSAKIEILDRILDHSRSARDRVVIFSQSLDVLDFLEARFLMQGRTFMKLTGSTATSKRLDDVDRFNSGDCEVYLISTKAGGVGLNLTGANRVVIMDSRHNPQDEEQAVGRTHRIGQLKPVFVYRLTVGGTFEDKLINNGHFKRQLALAVVDQERPRRQAFKSIDYLMEPELVDQMDLDHHLGLDCEVLDKLIQSPDTRNWIRVIERVNLQDPDLEAQLTEGERREVESDVIREERARRLRSQTRKMQAAAGLAL